MEDLDCGNMTIDQAQQPNNLYTNRPLYFEASGATAENINDLIHRDFTFYMSGTPSLTRPSNTRPNPSYDTSHVKNWSAFGRGGFSPKNDLGHNFY